MIKQQVAATSKRNELMQEQNILMFFTIPKAQTLNMKVRQYLELRQDEESVKL